MMSRSLAPALVLLVAAVAGCVGDSDPPQSLDPSGIVAAIDPDHGGARVLVMDALIESDGYLIPDQVACDPLRPGVCELYVSETIFVSGTWNGTFAGSAHGHLLMDGSIIFEGDYVFTGVVDECGEGAMTIHAVGSAGGPPDPAASGMIHGSEDFTFVPGTATTGMSRVVDTKGTVDFVINPVTGQGHGTMQGVTWCL